MLTENIRRNIFNTVQHYRKIQNAILFTSSHVANDKNDECHDFERVKSIYPVLEEKASSNTPGMMYKKFQAGPVYSEFVSR